MKNYFSSLSTTKKIVGAWVLVVLLGLLFYWYVPVVSAPMPTAFASEGDEYFDAEVKVSIREYFDLKRDYDEIFSPEAI